MIRVSLPAVALLVFGFFVLTSSKGRADDTIEFARQHMRCDAWLEIHQAGGTDANTMDGWSVDYLKRVAHDFAADMANRTGARSENDDGADFTDERVLTWLFLHCHDHPDDTLSSTAMNWAMALSLAAGPRPLPPY